MSKIAVKQLVDDGGNLRDALAAVWSYSRLTRTTEKEVYEGEYKATAIAFLDMCRRAEETHYFDINDDELPIHESLALVKLQKTADYLIDDFLDWVSGPRDTIVVRGQKNDIFPLTNCVGSNFLQR